MNSNPDVLYMLTTARIDERLRDAAEARLAAELSTLAFGFGLGNVLARVRRVLALPIRVAPRSTEVAWPA